MELITPYDNGTIFFVILICKNNLFIGCERDALCNGDLGSARNPLHCVIYT